MLRENQLGQPPLQIIGPLKIERRIILPPAILPSTIQPQAKIL
jgi:hypothetical protein